ncbi:venom dipeptidyl peptidase 4-like [Venturia canescens]|uniref:venom dipeptidyl peptidase 4-like n=1 Tax=Venturia canescens TaxID=32260 RepID=UPI001C9D50CC|nr:venom dipeptidyl peptidase 4-like [Venturia canescens]
MFRKTILQAYFLALITTVVLRTIEARSLQNYSRQDDDEFYAHLGNNNSSRVPYNLEEIYKGDFLAMPFNGTWISSNEILYENPTSGDILKYNVETYKRTLILRGSVLDEYGPNYACKLSPDHSHLLIGYAQHIKFRHSRYRKYAIYDLKTNTVEKIADGEDLLLAEWSTLGNSLIYERNNDLYYREVDGNGTCVTRRLTTDGVRGEIYNGVLDWVYEEEVMRTGSAIWFSPDGKWLAFASLNDTEVKTASYFYYGKPGDLDYQYPKEVFIKYPKAGTKNPDVALFLVNLKDPGSKLVSLEPPVDVVGTQGILFTVDWLKNDSVAAIWTNRVQNAGSLVSYDTKGKKTELLKMAEEKGWLEVSERILFHEDKLFIIKNQKTNIKEGKYEHVTSYEMVNGALTNERDLSPFSTSVQSLVKIDSKNGRIYYLATAPGEPSQKNLYSARVDGKGKPACVSCSLLTPEGNNCTYVSVSFSKDASNYALLCLGPDPPTVEIYNDEHKKTHTWENNEILREKLKKRSSVSIKIVDIPVNGYTSKAKMILPPGFNESQKYPMIVQVYAGPNTAAIKDIAVHSYNFYYSTNRSVIWTVIDGRGSAYRGSEMLYEIYRRFGTVEIEDQIAVTKQLQSMFPWIDSKRTGIWGWSYGGFAAAMALATDNENIFKCGISVAPVSSWIYYDSIYTERYMGLPTPEDNLAGYNRSDVTKYVEGIRGKKYMLIHGTGDDNVHYQQSMALAKSLAIADIPFEQISYPDEAHSLSGITPHLAHTLDHFWGECMSLSYARVSQN